ncbi:MAG TPA: hypothetical protein VFR23_25395 [Jiangellaceae bacterium]|nr:hypothetical protein [Jiangellaceae bacterium]
MRQIVASLTAGLPLFDILTVPSSSNAADTGFFVIAVPRSPNAPHAVRVNDDLRFPTRNGATTR